MQKLDFEIAVSWPTDKSRDRIFEGILDSTCLQGSHAYYVWSYFVLIDVLY